MKKILALVLVCVCALNLCAFAADFKDMPNDWSTAALEAAVKNGLLTGNDGYIKASDNLTRAEMATIMVRACGAVNAADLSGFTDVKADDWFYGSMANAVAMGAFKGSDGKLNPNAPITRQEAFVVLSRVFGVAAGAKVDKTVLDAFKDKDKVADWAANDVAAIIEQGYVGGDNGFVNPLNNISRAEFAVVMDRMVKYYIDDPSAKIPTDGNVMIRVKGVDLGSVNTDKMIVLADCIGDEDIVVKDAKISNNLVLRGGKNVSVSGEIKRVTVLSAGITLTAAASQPVYLCPGSGFKMTSSIMGIN